jgi:adenylate kinase
MKLVFIGPPGAGKSTVAEKVAAKHGLTYLSTGEMLRHAIARGTALGAQAKEYVDSGRLVPQEILGRVVAERLRQHEGFVLDGYPRTVEQAEFLSGLPEGQLDAAIYVAVPEEEAVERLRGRRACAACGALADEETDEVCRHCGSGDFVERADDRPETVKKRYQVYMRETEPVIGYYRRLGLLREVDGTGSREEVLSRVEAAIMPFAASGDDKR